MRPNTKAFFAETIGNPAGNVLDIETVAAIAHEHGLPLIVDNTFATPYLCRPIEWGADIVIHSATKFIGGHGTSIGGIVVESGLFNWSNGRFPVVAEPSPAYHGLEFHETFGTFGYLMKLRAETLRDLGGALSPFNAFLFLQGLETLSLRMDRHVTNALAVASFLESHELASNVSYASLPSSRYRPLVEKYLPLGAGAVFSFDCAGGRAGGQDLIRGVTPLVPPGQRRRRQEPDHPPRQHHPPPAQRRRAAGGRGRGGDRAAVGRHRVGRRPDLGSRAGLQAGRRDSGEEGSDVMTDVTSVTGADVELDLGRYQDVMTIQRVLHTAKTVAIVGLSSNQLRASNFVGYYLKRHGYRVIPVNPRETEILGQTCYPSLLDIPEHVDVVDVFRAPSAVPRDRPGGGGDRRRHPLVPARRDQRRGRPDRGGGRPDGDHGPLREVRARTLRGADALARLQHPPHHLGPLRPPVAGRLRSVQPRALARLSRSAS